MDLLNNKYQIRYGGYWRYPKLLDFCYFSSFSSPFEKIEEAILRSCSSSISYNLI